ncbi:hypothetical protein MJO28_015259 [Puccinia striiformis f. sp. tritici]|uniref:Uncharacterized protein n=1 Tax=Puccinia striiformis f. sp. tritici TaxID=168172 RepID=A0ACC0DTJ3_9BASI|nr:hypothetical protein MJO28_015259 [Puccinia striiformis f. sp. tritici]
MNQSPVERFKKPRKSLKQTQLPQNLTKKSTTIIIRKNSRRQTATSSTQQKLSFTKPEQSTSGENIGIDIETQCSPLTYQKIHNTHKIQQLNRAHGGWIEDNQQSSVTKNNIFEVSHYPMQDLSEPEDDIQVQEEEESNDKIVLCPESHPQTHNQDHTQLENNLLVESKQISEQQESFLIPEPRHQSSSCALFFESHSSDDHHVDDQRSEQIIKQPIILVHESLDESCLDPSQSTRIPSNSCALFYEDQSSFVGTRQLDQGEGSSNVESNPDDDDHNQESILLPQSEDDKSFSCALFFEETGQPGSKDHHTTVDLVESALIPPSQNPSSSCALFFENTISDGSLLDHEESGGKVEEEDTSKIQEKRIILAEESQEKSPERTAISTTTLFKSLAPPTPISTRLYRKHSKDNSMTTEPRPTKRKSLDPYSSSSITSNTTTPSSSKDDKKKRKKVTDPMEKVRPAWNTDPKDLIPKLLPTKLRQVGLDQFLVPIPSKSVDKQIESHQSPMALPLPKIFHQYHHSKPSHTPDNLDSKISDDTHKGKEKQTDRDQQEEGEDEIMDSEEEEDYINSSSDHHSSVHIIPDSQLDTPLSLSESFLNNLTPSPSFIHTDNSNLVPLEMESEEDLEDQFLDRILRAQFREQICSDVIVGDLGDHPEVESRSGVAGLVRGTNLHGNGIGHRDLNGRFNQDKNVNHDHHPSDHQEQDYHLSAKGKQSPSGPLAHPPTTLPLPENRIDLSCSSPGLINQEKQSENKGKSILVDDRLVRSTEVDNLQDHHHLSAKGKQSSSGLLNHPPTTLPLPENPTESSRSSNGLVHQEKEDENKKSYTEVDRFVKVIDNCPGTNIPKSVQPDPFVHFDTRSNSNHPDLNHFFSHRKQVILDHHSSSSPSPSTEKKSGTGKDVGDNVGDLVEIDQHKLIVDIQRLEIDHPFFDLDNLIRCSRLLMDTI